MVKNIFDKLAIRPRVGFIIVFVLLLLSYLLTFLSTQKVIRQANRADHINRVIRDLEKVGSITSKGSAIYRGYIIIKDPGLLAEYKAEMAAADSLLDRLEVAITPNTTQKENLQKLEDLVERKSSSMDRLIADTTKNNIRAADHIQEEGKLLSEIQNLITKIQVAENETWTARGEEVTEYTSRIKTFNIISIVLAILFTLFSILVYNRENREKKEESVRASEFRNQLENRVRQLADLNKELINLRSLEKYAVTGRIARTIAHEVRNPLTNINLSLEQLKVEIPESDNTNMFFNMISRNSNRINNLVGDLLNTTRVTELKQEPISVNELLEASLEAAADRIELKHIKIIKHFEEGMCKISADIEKLKIAFLNIIVNAIEAMDESGVLELTTESKKDKCVVKIRDTGVGMAKDQIDRLFEPYFTTKENGNGLGLANSQNIILSHNGSIFADSAPGKGTTFTIQLNFEPGASGIE